MNGFLNLYKPSGVSSAYVLNAVKRVLKRQPVGHMGTLDPLASGVLPVAIGKSTRLFDYLLDKTKRYTATIEFGYETDTLDLEGAIIKTTEAIPTEEEVVFAASKMNGDIMQLPPIYSAKCVNGKRSYELARKGKEVEHTTKKVHISYVNVIEKITDRKYKIEIECKGGTYIRSIARDLGYMCNSFATMTSLVRTASGIFDISGSISAEEFIKAEDKESLLIAPDMVVDFPIIRLTEIEAERLFNGLYDFFDYPDGIYRVYDPDKFYGVGTMTDGKLKVKAYLRND